MSIDINDLTFGAEFEVIMPPRDPGRRGERGRAALAEYLTLNGVDAQAETYNHRLRPHWKITTDGSIGHDNAELVSPILRSEEGLAEIRKICRLVDDWGCRVNRSCGHHVHVGVRDRFAGQIGFFKELLKTSAKFQPIFDQLVAPSRRDGQNNYCRPLRYTPEMDRATTLDELARLAGGNRFVTVNFYAAFVSHGTVEFRQHQGTINGEKSANWIRLCLRLVAHAAKNTEPAGAQPSSPDAYHRASRRWVEGVPAVRDLTAAPLVPNIDDVNRRSARLTQLVIRSIATSNPRRPGSQRHANWAHYTVGQTLRDFVRRGGRLDIARHDVAEGYVRIADLHQAPITTPEVHGRYEAVEPEPVTEPVAPSPAYERPPTDAAPVTLDGLMELIEASAAERSYFEERMMELNP